MPMDYHDSDNNGIPDVFENRRSISEILNDDVPQSKDAPRSEATEDRAYDIYGLSDQRAVLLELRGSTRGEPLEVTGACVFRSRAEVRAFFERLQLATLEAFGPAPEI